MTPKRRWMPALILLLLSCTGSEEAGAPGAPLQHWTLGEATAQLGSVTDAPDAFSSIRSVAIGPDGNLYVLLPQEACVKVFSPTGRFLASIGREGEGPGELLRPGGMGFLGDTLWVNDGRAGRVSFFHDGEFAGVVGFPDVSDLHPERSAHVGGVMAGRRVVVSTDGRTYFHPEETTTPSTLLLGAGESYDTLALFSSDHVGGFLVRMSGGQVAMMMPFVQPFQDQGLWTLGPDGSSVAVIHRAADSPDPPHQALVNLLGVSGDTIFSTPLPYDPVPIPEPIVDSLITRYAGDRFDRDVVESALYVPDHYPTVSNALIGADGTVWLAREATTTPFRRWTVLSGEGRPLAELEVPSGQELVAAGEGFVWTLWADELDVQHLSRYSVNR